MHDCLAVLLLVGRKREAILLRRCDVYQAAQLN